MVQIGKNYWYLATCRKSLKKVFLKSQWRGWNIYAPVISRDTFMIYKFRKYPTEFFEVNFINTFDPLFIGYFDWPFVLMRSKPLLVLMIPSDVFRLIFRRELHFFISSLWYMLCRKQNIIDGACWIISINLCFDLFWWTILSYNENKTSLGFFGKVILIFEGKINSTDGAKSEHCYALCSRIRLRLELKMWSLNVQKIITAWNSEFKIHRQIVNT